MCHLHFPLFPYELDASGRCWIGSPTETDTPGHQSAQEVAVQVSASGWHLSPGCWTTQVKQQLPNSTHFFWDGVVTPLVNIKEAQPKLIQDFSSSFQVLSPFFLFFFFFLPLGTEENSKQDFFLNAAACSLPLSLARQTPFLKRLPKLSDRP